MRICLIAQDPVIGPRGIAIDLPDAEIAILGVVKRFGEAQRHTHRVTDLSQMVRIDKTRKGFTVRAKIVQARAT
jgi:hypothetical protein